MNADAEYPNSFPASNSNRADRTLAAAKFLAQAKLLLLQQATQSPAWRKRQGLRETADRLTVLIQFLTRVSDAEAGQ